MSTFTVSQMRERARRTLPRAVFVYFEGGAGSDRGVDRNRQAPERILFSSRSLVDVTSCDLSVERLGERLPVPVVVRPTDLNGANRGNGDELLAKVAARNSIPFVLSTASASSIAKVAERVGGDLWFHFYVMDREIADTLVDRARQVGYRKLVLTVDVPVGRRRPRDQRNGFPAPFRSSARFLCDCLRHLARIGSANARDLDRGFSFSAVAGPGE